MRLDRRSWLCIAGMGVATCLRERSVGDVLLNLPIAGLAGLAIERTATVVFSMRMRVREAWSAGAVWAALATLSPARWAQAPLVHANVPAAVVATSAWSVFAAMTYPDGMRWGYRVPQETVRAYELAWEASHTAVALVIAIFIARRLHAAAARAETSTTGSWWAPLWPCVAAIAARWAALLTLA